MRGWRNGRLATLRGWCSQGRGGSNPLPRTKKVGVNCQIIIAIEKGNYIPSINLAFKLAYFLL